MRTVMLLTVISLVATLGCKGKGSRLKPVTTTEIGAEWTGDGSDGSRFYFLGGHASSPGKIKVIVHQKKASRADVVKAIGDRWEELTKEKPGNCNGKDSVLTFSGRVGTLGIIDTKGYYHELRELPVSVGNGMSVHLITSCD